MNFIIDDLLERKKTTKKTKNPEIFKIYISPLKSKKNIEKKLKSELNSRDFNKLSKAESSVFFSGNEGAIGVVFTDFKLDKTHESLISECEFNKLKNLAGPVVSKISSEGSDQIVCDFIGCKKDEILGFLCGLQIAAYKYDDKRNLGEFTFLQSGKKLNPGTVKLGFSYGISINQARHLVNLPPNILNPENYSKEITKHFSKTKFKVELFDEKFLKSKGYNLILAVGEGSKNKARILRLRYRARGAKGNPIAFIGKGITFDSGGLNMKPGVGMRLMKKDMGGSAALVGLARYIELNSPKKNIDIYLAIAENSVDERSTRPSDIVTAFNGKKIEIHNTDAEGRLALASAIQLSLQETGKNKPSKIIDVATLTGAGKVSLGNDITSLFSNNDRLSSQILKSASKYGDYCWRMPLYGKYISKLNSSFADLTNCASVGAGGAITAALFLEQFIEDTQWAHLDIFGWTTSNMGSHLQKGGSGQGVLSLVGLL